jgi:hypothetical protein
MLWLVFALVVPISCTSTNPAVRSRADVTVTAISPAAQSAIGGDTVFEADVAYRIEDFQSEPNRYFLTIQFEKVGGGSFNHYQRFTDEPALSAAQGSLHVSYALSHIWNDRRLEKPVRVWFYVTERTAAPHDSIVIGKAGPLEYVGK